MGVYAVYTIQNYALKISPHISSIVKKETADIIH